MKLRFLYILSFLMASCSQIVVRVDEIPANTPKGADLFLCGNFNYWDTSDEDYRLKMGADSAWYANIPMGIGEVNFWVTRGDWSSLEADGCGNKIAQRSGISQVNDTIRFQVDSWSDLEALNCELVTIVIDSLPDYDKNQQIILAGDFNGWNTEDTTYKARRDSVTGKYTVRVPRPLDKIDYKYIITQGDLRAAEADQFGKYRAPRELSFGREDTISIAIERWESAEIDSKEMFTLILENVPDYTPSFESIYVASNMNDWFPRDENWKMTKMSNGKYFLLLPRTDRTLSFKFTRGDWKSVEGDEHGGEIDNRDLRISSNSEASFTVKSWRDLANMQRGDMTIEVQLPNPLPKGESLYLTGDFNNWNLKDAKYLLKAVDDLNFKIQVPKAYAGSTFKVTRGSWAKEPCDSKGRALNNQKLLANAKGILHVDIQYWKDQLWNANPYLVLVLNEYPKKTPENAAIYISSDIDDWSLSNPDFKFTKNKSDQYILKLLKPLNKDRMEFKVNRGSWESVETERFGGERYNRMYDFQINDTLYLEVKNWADL